MVDIILKEIKPKMSAAIDNLKNELSKLRTGRANPSILDDIVIPYYGSKMRIKELASITVPDPGQIVIKPWERNALGDIETAIRASDIGLNPVNDGVQIRLIIPPMTEDRRKEIAGQVKKIGEEVKISVRNIRRDAWDKVQTAEKNGEATEDDKRTAQEELNKLIAEINKEIDTIVEEKEAEIMKI
ncbi:ribosome recycling factor [Candidatus Berkelbacteria bacterium CG10_big_fil_rev_8_21_14_0_10_43_13]|uniref:Ribosome-recycling factor n=1 Tax=Candidatus Berkelbacteria bacterium CG10_big_fil_rev_8_21_14_0_10_43_13 TaxID=1974514 RepID=A0A2H0W774_9BACT|nr:MAG: ribosome recycling factor [Candidatus Berkelbacteria bacterium CG10_big_fil_rev_8_21_14_0_10_43_13]